MRVSLSKFANACLVANDKDKFLLNTYNNLYVCNTICRDKEFISLNEYNLLSYLYMIALNGVRRLVGDGVTIHDDNQWYGRDRDIAAHQLHVNLSYQENAAYLLHNVKECCRDILPQIESLLKQRYSTNDINIFNPNIVSANIEDIVIPGDLNSVGYISKENLQAWIDEVKILRESNDSIMLSHDEIIKGFAYNMYCAQLLVSGIVHLQQNTIGLEYIAAICQHVMAAGNLLNVVRHNYEDKNIVKKFFGYDNFISDIIAQRNIIAHSLFVNSLDKDFLVNINYYNVKLYNAIRDIYQSTVQAVVSKNDWLQKLENIVEDVIPKTVITKTNKKGKKKTTVEKEEITNFEFENILREFTHIYQDKDSKNIDNTGLIENKKKISREIAENIFHIVKKYYDIGYEDRMTEEEFNKVVELISREDFDPYYALTVHFCEVNEDGLVGLTLNTTNNIVCYAKNYTYAATNKKKAGRKVEMMNIPSLLIQCKLYAVFNEMLKQKIMPRYDLFNNPEYLYGWPSFADETMEIFDKNEYMRDFMIKLDYYIISAKINYKGSLLEWAFINHPKFTNYLLAHGASFEQFRLEMLNIDFDQMQMATSFCVQSEVNKYHYVNMIDAEKLHLKWIPLKCSNELIELSKNAQNAMQYKIAGVLFLRAFKKCNENSDETQLFVSSLKNFVGEGDVDHNREVVAHLSKASIEQIKAKYKAQIEEQVTFVWSLEKIIADYCNNDFFISYRDGIPSPAQHLLLELAYHTNKSLTQICGGVDGRIVVSGRSTGLHVNTCKKQEDNQDAEELLRFERAYVAVQETFCLLTEAHKISREQFVDLQLFAIEKQIYAMYPLAHTITKLFVNEFGEDAFITQNGSNYTYAPIGEAVGEMLERNGFLYVPLLDTHTITGDI